jgi:hypothetical protein
MMAEQGSSKVDDVEQQGSSKVDDVEQISELFEMFKKENTKENRILREKLKKKKYVKSFLTTFGKMLQNIWSLK